eukprot:2052308-Prymnesium_polylepis.1
MAPGERNRAEPGTTRAAGRPAIELRLGLQGPPPGCQPASCAWEYGVHLPLHGVYTPCGGNAGRETRKKCSVSHVVFCVTPKCARLEARGTAYASVRDAETGLCVIVWGMCPTRLLGAFREHTPR